MKIILDAMGGDNAPQATVMGALMAIEELGAEIILVGRGEALLQVLADEGRTDLPRGLEIVHASQIIEMDDDPSASVREKSDSSIVVGLKLLAEGHGAAFVSAGSTGAVLTAATLIVKRIKGIRRAALSPILPTHNGRGVMLIDCGANTECTPEYLWQFAHMGAIYAKMALGAAQPRVGLLNIGSEPQKGDDLRRRTHALLSRPEFGSDFRFVGNVEGRDVIFEAADVIVADGFSGNILLKTIEGVGLFFADALKKIFFKGITHKLAALLVKKDLLSLKKTLDYSEYGGSPFLGVSKPVIKAHGSSNPRAVCSAIRQALAFAESGAVPEIERRMGALKLPAEEGGEGH